MKKPLIFISILVILITLWLNFVNTSTSNSEEITIKISKDKIITKDTTIIETQVDTKKVTRLDTILDDEIKQLLKKAESFLQESKDEEALKIYDLVIEKTSNITDTKILKHFSSACMSKGYIYQIYPNRDNDAAMEAYNMIINKFDKSSNIELIQLYIDAKIQLSYLLPNDEKIEAYNELLSKFDNNMDITIQKKLESLLITKSFQLMGQNDEEAMRILDKVIEKYQDKDETTNLPENIRFSILNNIELALITNNDSDEYVELAKKFMSSAPDTKPLLEMLEIIKNSQDINQDEALEIWKEEHSSYRFPDWSFQEVERWAYQIEDKDTKDRVSRYINAFVNHKYSLPDKYSDTVTYENSPKNQNHTQIYDTPYTEERSAEIYNTNNGTNVQIEEDTVNNEPTEDEVYQNDIPQDDNNTEEEVYPNPYESSEGTIYEPDPYVQEIYEATGEYPNPYE